MIANRQIGRINRNTRRSPITEPKKAYYRRQSLWIPVTLILLINVALIVKYRTFTMDDPYITFRYVYNVLHGHGPVWNVGEHVEGYSDPLWLCLLVFVGCVFSANLLVAAKLLSALFGIATVFACLHFSLRHIKTKYRALSFVAPLLVATSVYYAAWSAGALEITLDSFLVILFCTVILEKPSLRQQTGLGLICFLAAITRPEGILFAVIAVVRLCLDSEARNRPLKYRWLWLGIYCAVALTFLAWRWSYYHDLFPNTYYAKLGGGLLRIRYGLRYVRDYTIPHILIIVTVLMGFLLPQVRRSRAFLITAVCSGAIGVFAIYAGGDWMPGYRFLLPVFPLMCLAFQQVIVTFVNHSPRRHVKARLVYVSVFVFIVIAVNGVVEYRSFTRDCQVMDIQDISASHDKYTQVAQYLSQNAKRGDLIAIQEAGKIPYLTPQFRYLDIVGLNDHYLARKVTKRLHRDPGDPAYVVRRRPKWLVMSVTVSPDGSQWSAMTPTSHLIKSALVQKNYHLIAKLPQPLAGRPWSSGYIFWIYERNDAS